MMPGLVELRGQAPGTIDWSTRIVSESGPASYALTLSRARDAAARAAEGLRREAEDIQKKGAAE